ncbi:uncharacterized protein LOC124156061 [Ischnura elegans]|uniref:uncharacterized protein LOC124156061 n=1 Tax=Ischnura elegans TaxID=197161 RepID=UPI001ED87716|nr:uncharacterized protein LOC124156061 [Ischnura elegans]
MGKWSKEATIMLIEEIKKRPFLYDPCHKSYHDRGARRAAMQEIAAVISQVRPDTPGEEIKIRWSALRSAFQGCISKMRRQLNGTLTSEFTKVWYFDEMLFLCKVRPARNGSFRIGNEGAETRDSFVQNEDVLHPVTIVDDSMDGCHEESNMCEVYISESPPPKENNTDCLQKESLIGGLIQREFERENLQRQNLSGESLERVNLQKENPQAENLQIENVQSESLQGENSQRDNPQREIIQRDNTQREAIQRENLSREALRENIPREVLQRESIPREILQRENLQRENLQRDILRRENVQRDNFPRENFYRENLLRENLYRENLQRENQRESLQRENTVEENPHRGNFQREVVLCDSPVGVKLLRDNVRRGSFPGENLQVDGRQEEISVIDPLSDREPPRDYFASKRKRNPENSCLPSLDLSVKKLMDQSVEDPDFIFGKLVAHELKSLKSPILKKKLKHKIMLDIIEIQNLQD